MSNDELMPRYDLARRAAEEAGRLARAIFDGAFEVEWKADQSPVTVADRDAERHIRSMVAERFPGDGFVGEEYGTTPTASGFRWVIDPIDGTKSFVRGVPLWGTLVGLEYKGEVVAGAVAVPCLGQLYHAVRGGGAFRDDRRIRVSEVADLSQAHMCYSSIGWFRKAGMEQTFLDLAAATDRQRGFGDFYGFLLVAQGSMDFMIDHGVHPWDVAALVPIVEEAGGRMTDWRDRVTIDTPDTLASNGRLHPAVLRHLWPPVAG
jgi:histidinol-phosphatase